MQHSEIVRIPLRDLLPHPKNPRKITQENLNRLCDSIRQNGYWEHRPCAVEPAEDKPGKYYILDGNQRKKALGRLKRKDAPCMIYTELTDEERNEIILRSNINNGDWDVDMLQADFAPVVDFDAIGLEFEMSEFEPATATTNPAPKSNGDIGEANSEPSPMNAEPTEGEAEDHDRLSFYYKMMGDYLYPTDNEYQIPTLLLDRQPVHVELPLAPWGAEGRYKKGITTYHFYVDDYRFEQLFKNPILLLQSGCRAVVEPNVSIHDQTPVAIALYQIYRKRYLARYLQECGLQVWADLNVSPHLEEWNALGIPQGYNAFFTRGVSGWQPTLDRHLEMARRISECDHPNLVVYGGGKDIADWCMAKQVVHISEYMNNSRVKRDK